MNAEAQNNLELLQYIAKVKDELGKREAKLLSIEKRITGVESELSKYSGSKSVKKGDAALTMLSARYRNQLEHNLQTLRADALEAQREVTRAKDRLRVAEAEQALAEKNSGEPT